MAKPSVAQQLDGALQRALSGRPAKLARLDEHLTPLLEIALRLRDLPRPQFRADLQSALEKRALAGVRVEALPTGRQTAMPYLTVENAAGAIDFYRRAFGATESMRFEDRGKIGSAELVIENSTLRLADEFPDYGSLGPKALGGSPVKLHLYVGDVDAFVERAVSQGAKIVRPLEDQFYGDRSAQLADPFGHVWIIATRQQTMSRQEMQRRWNKILIQELEKTPGRDPIRKGFRTITPYMIAQDGPALLDFAKRVFAGKETFRGVGSAGGLHAEIRIGDSMLMIGGGLPGKEFHVTATTAALHVYVKDTDAVYQRALSAGATSTYAPADMEYGERSAGVKDGAGNDWYIATATGSHHVPKDLHDVNVYLHPLRADPVIRFLRRAFGGHERARYASPDGVVHHAKVQIGTSMLEMGEAHGSYQPTSTTLYLYVRDADAVYRNALAAGASSLQEPADQPWGDRIATVKDPFGTTWNIATHTGSAKPAKAGHRSRPAGEITPASGEATH